MTRTPTEELSTGGKVLRASVPHRTNVAKYAAINAVANTVMIVTIVMTDGDQRAAVAQQFPVVIDAIAAKMPVLISIASGLGLLIAAFRKSSHQDRSGD